MTFFAPATGTDIAWNATSAPTPIGAPSLVLSDGQTSGAAVPMVKPVEFDAPAGAMLLALTHSEGSQTPNAVTDTAGNTYVQAGPGTTVDTTHRSKLYAAGGAAALSAATDSLSFGYIGTGGNKLAVVAATTGVGALDVTATNTGTGTAVTATTAVLAQANSIVFAGVFIDGNHLDGAPTWDSGWTLIEPQVWNGDTIYLLYKIVASTAAVTFGATLPVSRIWSLQLAAFKGTAP